MKLKAYLKLSKIKSSSEKNDLSPTLCPLKIFELNFVNKIQQTTELKKMSSNTSLFKIFFTSILIKHSYVQKHKTDF